MITDSPMITGVGGICCVPRAFRRIEKTTENFTNEVDIISRKGASDRRLIMMSVETGLPPQAAGETAPSIHRFICYSSQYRIQSPRSQRGEAARESVRRASRARDVER